MCLSRWRCFWKASEGKLSGSVNAGSKGRQHKVASLPGPPCWGVASNRWREKINKSQQTGISRCVSSCSKVLGSLMVLLCIVFAQQLQLFFFLLLLTAIKKKKLHLIIQSVAGLRRDDWCRQLLTMWPELLESDYHGNILIREQCRLRGISLLNWYAPRCTALHQCTCLAANFLFILNGRRL